jgi:hypothetical protein
MDIVYMLVLHTVKAIWHQKQYPKKVKKMCFYYILSLDKQAPTTPIPVPRPSIKTSGTIAQCQNGRWREQHCHTSQQESFYSHHTLKKAKARRPACSARAVSPTIECQQERSAIITITAARVIQSKVANSRMVWQEAACWKEAFISMPQIHSLLS